MLAHLLVAGNLGETAVEFQWCSAIARFGRVCVQDGVMVIVSGLWVGFRVEPYALVLESIIGGRVNNTVMDNTSGIFCKNFESHGIPDIGSNANPPACFLFGRQERLIGVEVEDTFVKSVFEEGRDVLQSTMSKFAWDLLTDGFVSAYVVDTGNVLTSKQPTIFRCTCSIEEDLRMVFEKLHGAEFSWVLLRVFWFNELIVCKKNPLIYMGI